MPGGLGDDVCNDGEVATSSIVKIQVNGSFCLFCALLCCIPVPSSQTISRILHPVFNLIYHLLFLCLPRYQSLEFVLEKLKLNLKR